MKEKIFKQLIDLAKENNLQSISYEGEEGMYSISYYDKDAKIPVTVSNNVSSDDSVSNSKGHNQSDSVTAPMVGVFYSKPKPTEEPYVKKGSKVKKGQVLCLLEAMKTFTEVEAPFDCEIDEILLEDGGLAEFGQVLFKVKQ